MDYWLSEEMVRFSCFVVAVSGPRVGKERDEGGWVWEFAESAMWGRCDGRGEHWHRQEEVKLMTGTKKAHPERRNVVEVKSNWGYRN